MKAFSVLSNGAAVMSAMPNRKPIVELPSHHIGRSWNRMPAMPDCY
jgi:hypothetical protein